MTYYCSSCWKEIKPKTEVCLYCGANQSALKQEPFIQKLIGALKHLEPSTPIRAAEILGSIKAKEVLPY